MKHSKVLSISLGTITLSALTVATPFIITSCSSTDNFVDYKLSDDFLTLAPGAYDNGYRLIRQVGTNNYDFYSNNSTNWSQSDLNQLITKYTVGSQHPLLSEIDHKLLVKLGFDETALEDPLLMNKESGIEILYSDGVYNKDGKVVYPEYDLVPKTDLAVPDFTKSFTLVDSFKIFQMDNKKFMKDLKNENINQSDFDNPTPEVIDKFKKVFHNSINKNYNFRYKITIHPKQ